MSRSIAQLCACALLALTACVSVRLPSRGLVPDSTTTNAALQRRVRLGNVRAPRAHAAAFQEAVTSVLDSARLLAVPPEGARYVLSIDVVGFSEPETVQHELATATVRYAVKDVATGEPLLVRDIESSYEARMDESFRTVVRSRIAEEGALRENLDTLLDTLASVQVPPEPAEAKD